MKLNGMFLLNFFVSCLFLVNCNFFGSEKNSDTIVKGRVSFPVKGKIYFYSYANKVEKYLGRKVALDSVFPDSKGNYAFSLNWQKPELFELKTGDSVIANNFFLMPGDKLTLDFEIPNHDPEIRLNCESAKYSQFIVSFIDSFYEKPLVKHLYYIQTNYLTPEEFTFYINDRKQKQLKFYEKYFEGNSANQAFRNFMTSEIIYQHATDKLMYAWKKRMKEERIPNDVDFYSFLNLALIENENALSSPAYLRFLNLYVKDAFERMLEDGELVAGDSEKIIPAVEKYEITVQKLQNLFVEIVLFNIFYDEVISSNEKNLLNNFSETPLDTLKAWFCKKYPDGCG